MALFHALTLRGESGTLVHGYLTAARITHWTVYHHRPDGKHEARWTLRAQFGFIDRGLITKRPLLFSAKRQGLKGFWCFPLRELQIGDTQMQALLGPPER
jgi:hypothetical protein